MRSRMMRVVSIVVLLLTVVTAFSACATPAAPTAAPATKAPEVTKAPEMKVGELEVGVLWEEGTWFNMVKEIGDAMEKDYPGTKVIYTFNNTAASAATQARALAGDPLDVDLWFNNQDPSTRVWVDDGHVLDLTAAMNKKRADGTTWKDDFHPVFLTGALYKDKIWGAPEQVYIMLLHYNKKLFDKWGKKPPATWDELLELCEWIKQNGEGVAPIAQTGQVDYYVGLWWNYLTQRIVGGDKVMEYLYGDTNQLMVDDPGYLRAAQEMNKLVTNGYLMDGWAGTDFTTVQVYFFQERAAMILMGSWLMTEMKDSIPAGYELAVAPFPTVADGKGDQKALFGAAWPWSVAAKSNVPDLATEYLRRFTSNELSARRAKELGAVSPNANVPAPPGIGGLEAVLKDAATAEMIFYHYGVHAAAYGLPAAWFAPIMEMWMGKRTPEDAIKQIDTNILAVRAQRKAGAK
jgi:raffinose/stachyose/melibiose transport system substrate-binding protein